MSKKVSSKAVERNRIKRRCREAIRVFMKDISRPQALVFSAKRAAQGASSEDLVRDIAALLKKM